MKQSIAHTHKHKLTVGIGLTALRDHSLQALRAHHKQATARTQWLCPNLCTHTVEQSCAKPCVGLSTCRSPGSWSGQIRRVAYAGFVANVLVAQSRLGGQIICKSKAESTRAESTRTPLSRQHESRRQAPMLSLGDGPQSYDISYVL